MAAKNDNLPINADIDLHNGGTIKYANEVIAIIAGVAAGEVDGIAGMCTSGGIGDIISRNRNITRGIRVEMGGEEVSIDIYTIVEYGQPIQKVALEVQENVRKAIESMTGLHVVKVDVHVQGVSFEKENKERDAVIEATGTPALAEGKPSKKKKKAAQKNAPEAEKEPEPKPEAPVEQEEPAAGEASEPAADAPATEEPVPEAQPAAEDALSEAPMETAEEPAAQEEQAVPEPTEAADQPVSEPAEPEAAPAEDTAEEAPEAVPAEEQPEAPADTQEDEPASEKKPPRSRKPRRRA